jgi:hypothetical protein
MEETGMNFDPKSIMQSYVDETLPLEEMLTVKNKAKVDDRVTLNDYQATLTERVFI